MTNISAATCDVRADVAEALDEIGRRRSSAARPCGGGRAGGVASYRVARDEEARREERRGVDDERDVAAGEPPSPGRRSRRRCASIADQVALDSALAGSSSSADVMFGIVAVRAGSKNACAATVSAITT